MLSTLIDRVTSHVAGILERPSGSHKESLRKAEAGIQLSLEDLATLIQLADKPERERILAIAATRTRKLHGSDVGLIAPLYIDNHCRNSCKYCGMRQENGLLSRTQIHSPQQFEAEVRALRGFGYHTVELVAGSTTLDIATVNDYIETMERYQIVNTAFFFDTLEAAQYRELFQAHPDVMMVHWQETYLRRDYAFYHPLNTPKGNYERRLDAIEVAIQAGLRKYAIGVLFGLADPQRDVLLCIAHGRYLADTYEASPTALGLVRLQPSEGAELVDAPHRVDTRLHVFLAAILRLAFPEAEIIATSRETPRQIEALLRTAATFTNATCTTVPGGYSAHLEPGVQRNGQFFHGSPTFAQVQTLTRSIGLKLNPSRPLGRQ